MKYFLLLFMLYLGNIVAFAQNSQAGRLEIRDYVFKDEYNRRVHLSDFKGKVVILDFWASWCQPCIASFPTTKGVLRVREGQPLVLVTVNVDKQKILWKPAVRKHNVPGVHLYAKQKHPAYRALAIKQLPRYVILDKKGRVYQYDAKSPYEEQAAIDMLLKE